MKLRNKKTGEICDFLGTYSATPFFGMSVDYHNGEPKCYEYKSLAELNDEWEDYEPQEPLIRDKNERKAVRLWAYVNSIKEALYAERPDRTLCLLVDMEEHDYEIQFVGWIPTLKDGQSYTITELCGEEE